MNRLWHRLDSTVLDRPNGHSNYLPALLACPSAFALCLLTSKAFGVSLPFMAGTGAVLVSTVLGGVRPGLLAVAASIAFALALRNGPLGAPIVPANVVAAVLFDLGCVGTLELTQRARRRALLETAKCRAREVHLQSIFDSLPAALLVLDEGGFILVASAEACRLFDFDPNALRGLRITEIVHLPLSDDRVDPARLQTMSSALTDEPITGQRRDGSPLKLRAALADAVIPSGRLFTLYVGDIGQEVSQVRRVQELQDELVHMARLTALGEMGAAIAHELNQPLTAAANYLGYARRRLTRLPGKDATELADVIKEANQQVLRAGAVLKRLRSFVSRSGPDHREIDFNEVVAETVVLARLVLQEARAKLVVDISKDIGAVWGDKIQIQQVLLNLLRNAAEAVQPCASRVVTLSAQPSAEGVVVCVRDTGPGVSDETAARLFSPFNTSKPDGMGIGLAICRTIVEAHSGRIWCETPEGGAGAAFLFLLPRLAELENANAA